MSSPSPAARPAAVVLPVFLAYTAGYVDTLGFIALFSFFTAHVTGNFVVLGAALVQPHHGVVAKLLALPTFILAVATTRLFERTVTRAGRDAAPLLLGAQFVFLVTFQLLGVWASPVTDGDAPAAIATALCGVVAMGVQNAASRTVFASLSSTTVMTGNVTQLVIDGVDLVAGVPDGATTAIRTRMHKMWPPVVAFGAGAASGALGYAALGFPALGVPAVLVLGLTVHAIRRAPK